MRRSAMILAGVLLCAACSRGRSVRALAPVDRAYVPSGQPVPLAFEAEGVSKLSASIDGVEAATLLPVPGTSLCRGLLPGLARGEHRLTVTAPEIEGIGAEMRIFADRMPDPKVDGFLVDASGQWAVVVSGSVPADDGTPVGRLTLEAIPKIAGERYLSRTLSEHGIGATIQDPDIAWIEGWEGGAGTLVLDTLAGEPSPPRFSGVRGAGFSPNGLLGAIDEGAFVVNASRQRFDLTARADALAFVGGGDDVIAFAVDGSTLEATFGPSPDFSGIALVPRVTGYEVSPGRREVALRRADTTATGALLLFDYSTVSLATLLPDVSGAAFSPDGAYLAAIEPASADLTGPLAILPRETSGGLITVGGTFDAAIFTKLGTVIAHESGGGALSEIALASGAKNPFASSVAVFKVLDSGAVAFADTAGGMWVRRVDGAVLPVGTLDAAKGEVVLAADAFAFTAIAAGGTHPIRVVDAVTGATNDFGIDAIRPAFLGKGAIVWGELRADAQAGALGNYDLWMFPRDPASIVTGATMLAERVKTDARFAVGEDLVAVLSDLPRPGKRWNAHARCFDGLGRGEDLGPTASEHRDIRAIGGSRVLWFDPDRVLYLGACHPL